MSSPKNLVNLDFLRSVAVLLVATSHLLLYLGRDSLNGWAGLTGVCMFFVHTSLVLMWSLERDPHIGRFYVRRIFRIYPLWLLVLFLTVVTRLPMSPEFAPGFGFHHPGPWELLANAALVFNLWFGTRVVGASWTLPIEVQMYLFLPFLFAYARSASAVWPLLLLDAFIMVYAREKLPLIDSSLLMVSPYFIAGIIAYVLCKQPRLRVLPGWTFPLWLLIYISAAVRYGDYRMAWLFCLALGLSIPLFRDMTLRPVRIVAHHIAKYSYGIYLGHMAAIGVSIYTLRPNSTFTRVSAFVALFCLLPVLFYHAVEEPMIRFGSRLAKRIQPGPAPRVNQQTFDLEPAP